MKNTHLRLFPPEDVFLHLLLVVRLELMPRSGMSSTVVVTRRDLCLVVIDLLDLRKELKIIP